MDSNLVNIHLWMLRKLVLCKGKVKMLKKRYIFNFSQLTLEMATIKRSNPLAIFSHCPVSQARYKVYGHATPAQDYQYFQTNCVKVQTELPVRSNMHEQSERYTPTTGTKVKESS